MEREKELEREIELERDEKADGETFSPPSFLTTHNVP